MYERLLRDNEEVLEIYRSHEITLAWPVFKTFFLLFMPWFFAIEYGVAGEYESIFVIYTAIVCLYLAWKFVIWYLNVYIITTSRLIEIQRSGVFSKEVLETPLERILNVSFRTTGFVSTLFGYGDVLVQVVGLEQPIDIEDVPTPHAVKDFLWAMHEEHGGLAMQPTHTTPEIAPVGAAIPYAPKKKGRWSL
jgi:hypothetical protein